MQCRVSADAKARLRTLAQERGVTESALLQRLIELALLQGAGLTAAAAMQSVEPVARGARLYVRLRREDHLLLRERAEGRGLPAATYASMVLRAHLRAVTPLPDRELDELKRAIAGLAAIGRNLNQLARVAHTSTNVPAGVGTELRALLRAVDGLRNHFTSVVRANLESWESGNAQASR